MASATAVRRLRLTSLPAIKFLSAAAILAVSLLGLFWAARVGRNVTRGHGLANAFAAGVFLGTGLLHFGVEARRGWVAAGAEYPWAELLALAAFLGMLFIEHVALSDAAHTAIHAHTAGAHDQHAHAAPTSPPSGRGIGILVALSLHSFLAGTALGIARDLTQVALATAAILAHKLTEGFALGTVLGADLPAQRVRAAGWVFAAATPVGILLGGVTSTPLAEAFRGLFAPSFAALAAGTFLYIGSFDLLQDEFVQPGGRVAKWTLACLGVALSAVLATTV